MPGAGKSICVDYLANTRNWPSVYFGEVTLDEIKTRGFELNPENEKKVREDLRAKEGMGAYAVRASKKIDKLFSDDNNIVVADGLYSWSEYKIFKEKYGVDAIIIAIVAPRALRHQRLVKREVRPLSEQEVSKREYDEIENIEKGGPIANADYTILNQASTKDLASELDQLLTQLDI